MAIIEYLWVAEKATVTGTGSITLPGTPFATGDRTFVSAYVNGDQLPYVIRDGTTGDQEGGIGTISISGGVATLARTVVIGSSNANAAVNFAGNACAVFASSGQSASLTSAPSGYYASPNGTYSSSTSFPSNEIHHLWIPLYTTQEWSGAAVLCIGAPSPSFNARVGLYDFTGAANGPGNLIYDAGYLVISTTGNISLTFGAPQKLHPPGVWLAVGYPSTSGATRSVYFTIANASYGLPIILNTTGNAGMDTYAAVREGYSGSALPAVSGATAQEFGNRTPVAGLIS